MTPPDLDALGKLADAFDSGAYSTSGAMARTYGAGGKIRAAQDIKALIAELKTGREAVEELLYAHTDKSIAMGEAFLARNGTADLQKMQNNTPRNAPRGLSDEC